MKSSPERFHASILTIGDELLKGSTLNSNAQYLAKELTHMGFFVVHQISCPDEIKQIQRYLQLSLEHSDLVILSGGLGPTPDDLTRDAIAAYFQAKLQFSSQQYKKIQKVYQRYGKKVPSMVKKEAMFPAGSRPILNHYGIALGFWMQHQKKSVIALPGVPKELEKMFELDVKPLIQKRFALKPRPCLVVKTIGISEPEVMKCLQKDFFDDPFEFGIYPSEGEVALRLYGSEPVLKKLKKKVMDRLHENVYAYEEELLVASIGSILEKKRQTLALAESCTGGLIASMITHLPGASRFFRGGVVAYDNQVKTDQLGVPAELIRKFGAVSEQTVCAMAVGARWLMNADYALAVSGVAGPDGDSSKKPVGRVYMALATPFGVRVIERDFWGNRGQIQTKASKKALEILWREIAR